MSSASGVPGKRPGFFDSFRAALTPAPLPPDDGKPIAAPTVVKVSSILAILGGLVMVFLGGLAIATADAQLELAVDAYNAEIASCRQDLGGIGEAVTAPPESAPQEDKDRAALCSSLTELTPERIESARSAAMVNSIILIVIGLIVVVGGWFVRSGAGWSRWLLTAGMALLLVLSFLAGTSIVTLAVALMVIIAVMLCFIGSGSAYFARLRARRQLS